jgi:hypothetical protein
MFPINRHTLLFLFACIPVRIIIALMPLYFDSSYLPYYGSILLLPALGFLYLYFNNLRLNAPEGGGNTWWAEYRIIHGMLYLTAAIYALQEKKLVWVPLTIDVALGIVLFLFRYVL